MKKRNKGNADCKQVLSQWQESVSVFGGISASSSGNRRKRV